MSVFRIQEYKPLEVKDCRPLHHLVAEATRKHLWLKCIQPKGRCVVLAVWGVIRDAEANVK